MRAIERHKDVVVKHTPAGAGAQVGVGMGREAMHYETVFEHVPVALYITTPEGHIIDANVALAELLGFERKEELLGMLASGFFVRPREREKERLLLKRDGMVRDFEARLRRRDGETVWVRDTCRAIRDSTGTVLFYEGTLQDITAERHYRGELAYIARHDPLTGTFNRYALDELLEVEIARAERHGYAIGLLMVDVDQFKEVNDRFGHLVGDRVLQEVARVLRMSVRRSDVVVRYGGDEFLILLPRDGQDVAIVKDRICEQIARLRLTCPLGPVPVSVSIGFTHWVPQGDWSIGRALQEADRAMYEEKNTPL